MGLPRKARLTSRVTLLSNIGRSNLERKRILSGVKVVDFCWAAAGPLVGKHLGDYGAEVIRIESSTRLCATRRIPPFKDNIPDVDRAAAFLLYNNDKYGITLNLGKPEGTEIAKKLIAKADIVTENFSPRAMDKWGLGYNELKKINHGIIMLSMPIMGKGGPHEKDIAYGFMLQGLVGLSHLSGWPDRMPAGAYAFTDFFVPPMATAAIVAALDYRRRTGKGQYIEMSQFEASTHCLGTAVLDYTANGVIQKRKGNRHEYAAPHAAYRCKGEDRWCTIAVFTDKEWQALCKIIGDSRLSQDPRLSTFTDRKQNEETLNRLIEEWTINYTPKQVMTTLQTAGVPAGVVYDISELYDDPQLNHRKHFRWLRHPIMGKYSADASPFRLSKTPGGPSRPGNLLGEHNELVYKDILGMSEEEYIRMLLSGVFE